MRSLSSTITKENLENQINAVQEERRLRVDNVPYGKVGELLPEMAYQNFGYKHSVIGSMADLSAASLTAGWLARNGARYGLCQIYRNESWHFELRPEAVRWGCPAMYADPTHDPRMRR